MAMKLEELTYAEAKQRLAGDVRNHMANENVIFSPWYDLDLMYSYGMFLRVNVATASTERSATPILERDKLMQMSDDQIWHAVMGGKKK